MILFAHVIVRFQSDMVEKFLPMLTVLWFPDEYICA